MKKESWVRTSTTTDIDPDEFLKGVLGMEGAKVTDGELEHGVAAAEEAAASLVIHVCLTLVKL